MDSAAMALRHPLSFRWASSSDSPGEFKPSSKLVMASRRRIGDKLILSSKFYDQGHLRYYSSNHHGRSSSTVISGSQEITQKKMKKKQLKLLKKLSRNLSKFSHIGSGLNSNCSSVDGDSGNIKISETPELLLERLQELKLEEKELKKKTKQEKAAWVDSRSAYCVLSSSSSSSSSLSSSESSSDSECGSIIGKKNLKHAQPKQINCSKQVIDKLTRSLSSSQQCPSTEGRLSVTVLPSTPEKKSLQHQSSRLGASNVCDSTCTKKIEVCMGGKCRRSGAEALLEKFHEFAGIETAVLGCKCMGRCRDGPNVRVLDGSKVNTLCTGVGLEDVDMIADDFISQDVDQLSSIVVVDS